MNKRLVGQDLPTKEGHGGLGPETTFLGSLKFIRVSMKLVPITFL
jgi:hypothetical protein